MDRTYFNESDGDSREKRKIILHCTAWGGHLDWFFSYTVPSLLQEGNIPSLVRDGFELRLDIYTHPDEFEAATERHSSAVEMLGRYMPINQTSLKDLNAGWLRGYYVQAALIDQIKRCIDEDATMFLAAPDMIFGNRSMTNAVRMIQGKNVCLASPHARLSPDGVRTSQAFSGLKRMERTIENDELVDLAFEHGEPSLLGFFDDQDTNKTHAGVSIRKIQDSTYSVIHNVPTPFLANFVSDDLKFFSGSGSSYDARWPRLLLRQNRLKIVGSSDVFFNVELAPKEKSNPEFQSGLLNNDKYFTKDRRLLHNYVCNSFCCIWRGRGSMP